MSWDIHFQDFPDVASIDEIPDDYVPKSIGTRSEIIERIKSAFPQANFTEMGWGVIDGGEWSIEINVGEEEDCEGFMLHVRGGGDAITAVERIAEATGIRGIDIQTSQFFTPESAMESFKVWQEYRDQAVSGVSEPLPVEPKKRSFFSRLFSAN